MADTREGLRDRSSESNAAKPTKTSNLASKSLEDLQPDLILVYPSDHKADIRKGVEILSTAGYLVAISKGASSTTLVLVRAEAGLQLGGSARSVAVQRRISLIPLPGVIDRFPPYNSQNSIVSSKLVALRNSRSVEIEADNVEALLGPQAAASFEFENYMLRLFALFAVSGVQLYLFRDHIPHALCVVFLFTGTIAVALWKDFERRRKALKAIETSKLTLNRRPEYKGTSAEKRERIRLLFLPFAALLMSIYALGLMAVLAFEIFCTQIYDGPLKGIVRLFPAGANVVASQVYGIIYKVAINKFTEWEDYPTEEALNEAKSQRQFYLQALLGYMPIVLTAYLYLPFGHLLIGVVPELRSSQLGNYFTLTNSFQLDRNRLYTQTRFYTLTQPLIALIVDPLLPLGMYAFKRYVLHKAEDSDNRFALEQLKIPFDSNAEAQKVVICFGYLLIVSPIWPFASVVTFVLLYARKLAMTQLISRKMLRKPVAYTSSRDIGFWSNELLKILLAGSIVAPTISFMYNGNRSYYDLSTSFVDASWLSVALVALLSENVVLGLYNVAANYLESTEAPLLTTPAPTSEKPIAEEKGPTALDSEQDRLWAGLKAHAE